MEMKTQILTAEQLDVAVELLKNGECVAFPTETVYGLGANALDEEAVKKIFLAKGRPADNPLIIHCASKAQVFNLVTEIHPEAEILMKHFWPGPLSLVLSKSDIVPKIVTGAWLVVFI